MAPPKPQLVSHSAKMALLSYKLHIRFIKLHEGLSQPEVYTEIYGKYCPTLVDCVVVESLAISNAFRRAWGDLMALDEVTDLQVWARRYQEARALFNEAADMLHTYEEEAGKMSLEWEVIGLKEVLVMGTDELRAGFE